MQSTEFDVQALVENGFDRDTALAALSVYGTAERVLLHQICGEDLAGSPTGAVLDTLPGSDDLANEAAIGYRYDKVLRQVEALNWSGVDLRKDADGELCETIVNMGADFLRQATDQSLEPSHTLSNEAEEHDAFIYVNIEEKDIQLVMEFGFTATQAREALMKTDGNVERAVAILLDLS